MCILVRAKGEKKIYVQDHSKYNKPQELNDKLYFILHLFIFNCAFLIFLFFYFVKYKGPEAPHWKKTEVHCNWIADLFIIIFMGLGKLQGDKIVEKNTSLCNC